MHNKGMFFFNHEEKQISSFQERMDATGNNHGKWISTVSERQILVFPLILQRYKDKECVYDTYVKSTQSSGTKRPNYRKEERKEKVLGY